MGYNSMIYLFFLTVNDLQEAKNRCQSVKKS